MMNLGREWMITRSWIFAIGILLSFILSIFYLYNGWKVDSVDYVKKKREENYWRAEDLGNLLKSSFGRDQSIQEKIKTQIHLLDEEARAKEQGDWEKQLETSLSRRQLYQVLIDQGLQEVEANFHYEWEIEKYLFAHKIVPKNSLYEGDAVNMLSMYAQDVMPWLVPILAFALTILSYLSEKWTGGIKLLIQSSKKCSQIAFEKSIASWLGTMAISLSIASVLFLLGLCFFGYGVWEYPVVLLSKGHALTAKEVFLRSLLTGGVSSLLTTCLVTLLVLLYRKKRSDLL